MELPALGSDAARVREQSRRQEQAPDEPVAAVTGFIVYITPDGRYLMDADINKPVTVQRPPSRDEITATCGNIRAAVLAQAQTEATTMTVLGNMSRMQADPQYQMMLDQARTQALAAAAAAANVR